MFTTCCYTCGVETGLVVDDSGSDYRLYYNDRGRDLPSLLIVINRSFITFCSERCQTDVKSVIDVINRIDLSSDEVHVFDYSDLSMYCKDQKNGLHEIDYERVNILLDDLLSMLGLAICYR